MNGGVRERDVLQADAFMSQLPGYGFIMYGLGLLTVPIEVFIRRDLGQRYFNQNNFLAGLIVLTAWRGAVNFFAIFKMSGGKELSYVIALYVIVSGYQMFRTWWKNNTGRHIYSFSSGIPWLLPLGRGVMWIINPILGLGVYIIVYVLHFPGRKLLKMALPVIKDAQVFTERFVEPAFVLFLSGYCMKHQMTAVGLWLLFSVMALNVYTALRHQADQSYVLDILDSFIESRELRQALSGQIDNKPSTSRLKRILQSWASKADEDPEVMDAIKDKHPNLADIIGKVNTHSKPKPGGESSELEMAV